MQNTKRTNNGAQEAMQSKEKNKQNNDWNSENRQKKILKTTCNWMQTNFKESKNCSTHFDGKVSSICKKMAYF